MAKLTKQQIRDHLKACEMLQQAYLSYDERLFVLDHWHESANHMNGIAGAFFTPYSLAREVAIEAGCHAVRNEHGPGLRRARIVDLCAGIGALALACWEHSYREAEITCVEINPDYVAVGKKVLPEARWVRASIFDYRPAPALLDPDTAKPFDVAISNPPFGRVKSDNAKAPRYTGGEFEFKAVDIAEKLAREGVFILPQMSLPFRYSGQNGFDRVDNAKYEKFREQTGITLSMNCGMDTSVHKDEWNFPVPLVEIALGFRGDE